MTAGCEFLDTEKASSEYSHIDLINLSRKNLINVDEIIYFSNVDTIYLNNNLLNNFPEDISSFRSLTRLELVNNNLTTAPTIKYNNSISGDTAVKLVYLKNNQINYLPPSWDEANLRTQVVDLYNNELSSIPTFNNYPELRRLDLRQNRLSFEFLIPIKNNPLWVSYPERFYLFPQKPFFAYDTIKVKKGENVNFDISRNLASNEYDLLKDDRRIDRNRTGVFTLSNIQEADTGIYWFKIHNDEFPDDSDFLSSEKFIIQLEKEPIDTLSLAPFPIKNKDVTLISPNGDGVADFLLIKGEGEAAFYNKTGGTFKKAQLPYKWYGDDGNGNTLEPGLYYIKKEDNSFIKVLIVR